MSYVTLIFSDNNLNQLDYCHLINNDIIINKKTIVYNIVLSII